MSDNPHFVLRDHVKPNASFLHTDSFDEALDRKATEASVQTKMATFHNMTRLVANMPDVMLEMLIDSVSTKLQSDQVWAAVKKKYNFGSTLYVEAQVHSGSRSACGRTRWMLPQRLLRLWRASQPRPVRGRIAIGGVKYGAAPDGSPRPGPVRSARTIFRTGAPRRGEERLDMAFRADGRSGGAAAPAQQLQAPSGALGR